MLTAPVDVVSSSLFMPRLISLTGADLLRQTFPECPSFLHDRHVLPRAGQLPRACADPQLPHDRRLLLLLILGARGFQDGTTVAPVARVLDPLPLLRKSISFS